MGYNQGFYGFDFLSILLLIISGILNIWPATSILGIAVLLIVVYRTFSKNIYKRENENTKFREGANKFLNKIGISIPNNLPTLNTNNIAILSNKLKYEINQRKKYKTVKCPGCHTKLKLPRGRGKVIITCKHCSTEFKAKV